MTFKAGASRAPWRIVPSGLELPGLLALGIQRYLVEDAPPLPDLPRSFGAVQPSEIAEQHYLVPLHDGEAIWIGISFLDRSLEVRLRAVTCTDGPFVDLPVESGVHLYPGLVALAGFVPAGREGVRFAAAPGSAGSITIEPLARQMMLARLELVGPDDFRMQTGTEPPPPARRDDAYGGWRLP